MDFEELQEKRKKSFVFYSEWLQYLDMLKPSAIKALFHALGEFFDGGMPKAGKEWRLLFEVMTNAITRDWEKWERTRKRRLENIKKANEAKKANAMQMQSKCGANAEQMQSECKANAMQNEGVNGNVNVNGNGSLLRKDRGSGGKRGKVSFDKFWTSYPKKIRLEECWKVFDSLNLDEPQFEKIMKALERQKKSEGWRREEGRFVPAPSVWLKDRRWEEETPGIPPDLEEVFDEMEV